MSTTKTTPRTTKPPLHLASQVKTPIPFSIATLRHGSNVAISTTSRLNSIGHRYLQVQNTVKDKTTQLSALGGASWLTNTAALSSQATT